MKKTPCISLSIWVGIGLVRFLRYLYMSSVCSIVLKNEVQPLCGQVKSTDNCMTVPTCIISVMPLLIDLIGPPLLLASEVGNLTRISSLVTSTTNSRIGLPVYFLVKSSPSATARLWHYSIMQLSIDLIGPPLLLAYLLIYLSVHCQLPRPLV